MIFSVDIFVKLLIFVVIILAVINSRKKKQEARRDSKVRALSLWSDANLSGSDEFVDLRERLADKIRNGRIKEYGKTYDDVLENMRSRSMNDEAKSVYHSKMLSSCDVVLFPDGIALSSDGLYMKSRQKKDGTYIMRNAILLPDDTYIYGDYEDTISRPLLHATYLAGHSWIGTSERSNQRNKRYASCFAKTYRQVGLS